MGADRQREDDGMITCTTCGTDTDKLEIFPGDVCLTCWADSPEGRRMPTAEELVSMWGGGR
jgi:hypothetical protein